MASSSQKRQQLLGHWLVRLLALLVSFIIWFYVLNSRPTEIEKKLSVIYIAPKNFVLANNVDHEVTVIFKGPRAFLQDGASIPDKIYVNLNSPAYNGRKQFNLRFKKNDIPLPVGVVTTRIVPGEVKIVLVRKAIKQVPVVAQLVGDLPANFSLVSHQIRPKSVYIEGPQEEIREVSKVMTTPIDLGPLNSSGNLRVGLLQPSRTVKIKENKDSLIAMDDVQLDYDIRPTKANFVLKNVDIRFLTSLSRFKPSATKVAVSVLALGGAEKTLKKSQVQVVADIPNGKKGETVKVELRASLPDGVHLLQIHPRHIKVKID